MPLGTPNELKIVLSLKDKASAKLKKFNRDFKGMAKTMAKVGAVAGVAIAAGIGSKAISSAADFEKAMSNVATLVDTSTESMSKMGKQVRDISKRVPVDLGELTSSLYDVRSAGIDAGGAMEVLENSAKLAVTGLGTTKEATDILTSAINAFGLDSKKSDKVADVFFKTVKSGKTTVAELAQGFGQVAPLASQLGIQFEDLMSVTAAMTTSGMKASVAYTQQRAILSSMLKPTKEMEEAMKTVDITSENLSETLGTEGLWNTIMMLSDAVDGDQAELAKMFGSVEGLNAVMMILNGTGMDAKVVMDDMTKGSNKMDEALKKQKETTTAQYQLLKNQFGDILIELGTKILPYVIKAMDGLIYAMGVMGPLVRGLKRDWDWWIDSLSKVITKYDEVNRKIEEFIGKVKRIPSGIGEGISGIGAKVGGFLGFQQGGIVPGPIGAPIPAIVHGGEAIIPAGRGMGGITVNITGNTLLDENSAEKIGDLIIERLKLQLRI